MKSIWENSWFMISVLLFFNIGLALSLFVPYGHEILYLNDLRKEPFNSIFKFVTHLGEAHAYIICGAVAMLWHYRYALLIALTGLVTMPMVYFFKESFSTDRPITFFGNQGLAEAVITVPGVILNVGQTSFPSGHTMAAFGLYSLLAVMIGEKNRRWGLPLALLAVSVGVSRVFLVQHFLADILAGAVLGLVVSRLVLRLDQTPFFQKMKWLDGGFLTRKKEKKVAVKS